LHPASRISCQQAIRLLKELVPKNKVRGSWIGN
jgi:hypothetical protein